MRRGEIIALVGENGAGKSTVVRCIARTFPLDTGTFVLDGRPLATDPIGARDQGIAVVWQDLALCDNLSIVANLFLGGERTDRTRIQVGDPGADQRGRCSVPMPG